MAWNSTARTKDIAPVQEKRIPIGAPAAMNPGVTNSTQGYRDGWDIERAYRDGVSKVTWLFRAIDAISSNQAKLPMHLHAGNKPNGEVITDEPVLDILNAQSNVGENAFIFRYRLSAQLLMSTRGVFIEVVRDSQGRPLAVNLLPPQHTSPIPHPTKFVSGFEVAVPNTPAIKLPAKDVIWVRRPHPLDPYLSMTPMESAGVAIEVEMLAKLYNRQFLLNDGRPGGLLVLRSEIDDDDKQELASRFRGNINRTGSVGVISSEDGADFVDTAASPRDAAYVQMRELTKEEILGAFGVPESIIGNASGRTFSNAQEEGKVFWMETMESHLELLARPLSHLTPDHLVAFNTDKVPVLVLAKQEQSRFALEEFRAGLISANEYREIIGKKKIESELADALLANPNLTPMGNTEKATPPPSTGIQEGTPLDAQAGDAQQEAVTEFDPESGQFEEIDAADGGGSGTLSIELPAAQAPSELAEDEVTDGPLVKGLSPHRTKTIREIAGTI